MVLLTSDIAALAEFRTPMRARVVAQKCKAPGTWPSKTKWAAIESLVHHNRATFVSDRVSGSFHRAGAQARTAHSVVYEYQMRLVLVLDQHGWPLYIRVQTAFAVVLAAADVRKEPMDCPTLVRRCE
jgi:hypothetical protein